MPDTHTFCEACGAPLGTPDVPNSMAQGTAFHVCRTFEDGYCVDCGRAEQELPLLTSSVAGDTATHTGQRHHENQDSVATLELPNGWSALAVADGVSCSTTPALASQTAIAAAFAWLTQRFNAKPQPLSRNEMAELLHVAHRAVCELPFPPGETEPETTFAIAVKKDRLFYYGWVGDARIYTFSENQMTCVTEDDSVLQQRLSAGIPYQQAIDAPDAHAILQCFGMRDSNIQPHVGIASLKADERLLLCSDGLWNYFETEASFHTTLEPIRLQFGIEQLPRLLVDYANRQGGHDNISIAVSK
jgi:PPM family protein phosphatase